MIGSQIGLANMFPFCSQAWMRQRKQTQRVITLATKVLQDASYGARTHSAVNRAEVRLALAVLWCVLKDRKALHSYWERATHPEGKPPWDSCFDHNWGILAALRKEGWHAPPEHQ